MKHPSLLLLLVFTLVPFTHKTAVASSGKIQETLQYNVMSHNNKVATVSIKVDKNKGRVTKMQGEVKTEGTLWKVYPVHNRQITHVKRNGNPSKTFQKRSESTWTENFNIRYKKQKVHVFYEKSGKENNRVRRHSGTVQDVLTALHALSTWNLEKTPILVFTMFSGKQFYRVTAKPGLLEEIWTPYNSVSSARKIDITIEKLSHRGKVKEVKMSMWVKPGQPDYPIKATYSALYVGSVDIILSHRSSTKVLRKARSGTQKALKVRGPKK
tara:strand:- start:376 stop:1182 length:807 start_codon:yes stop_codon:yes gene_type:complete